MDGPAQLLVERHWSPGQHPLPAAHDMSVVAVTGQSRGLTGTLSVRHVPPVVPPLLLLLEDVVDPDDDADDDDEDDDADDADEDDDADDADDADEDADDELVPPLAAPS